MRGLLTSGIDSSSHTLGKNFNDPYSDDSDSHRYNLNDLRDHHDYYDFYDNG